MKLLQQEHFSEETVCAKVKIESETKCKFNTTYHLTVMQY